ncbi:MAG: hypothetical protein QXN39_05755, partial [Archaeoglobaceae archaeon]
MGKKELGIGIVLAVSFIALLGLMMSPIVDGKNFIAYADERFDTYAKHSSYFIPEIKSEAGKFQSAVSLEIDMKSEESAKKTSMLYADFA